MYVIFFNIYFVLLQYRFHSTPLSFLPHAIIIPVMHLKMMIDEYPRQCLYLSSLQLYHTQPSDHGRNCFNISTRVRTVNFDMNQISLLELHN